MAKTKQVAALPWRWRAGEIEFLLVTTRTTKRWMIPKGWPMADRADYQAAAQEALEEAGVVGNVSQQPIGSFNYMKVADSGSSRLVHVDVYPLEVTDVLENWFEKLHRTRRWMNLKEATELAGEIELVGLFQSFSDSLENPQANLLKQSLNSFASVPEPDSMLTQVISWLKGGPR